MSTVEEIQQAIKSLPREDYFRLHNWLHKLFEDQWDKEMREDIESGLLADIAEEALKEHRSGKTSPFPADEK